MPTHRYPLSDGREVEIAAPLFNGNAYIYVDGEFAGENTLHELRYPHDYTLALLPEPVQRFGFAHDRLSQSHGRAGYRGRLRGDGLGY